jgi:hypothetical protein
LEFVSTNSRVVIISLVCIFPIAILAGAAGSGKSTTVRILARSPFFALVFLSFYLQAASAPFARALNEIEAWRTARVLSKQTEGSYDVPWGRVFSWAGAPVSETTTHPVLFDVLRDTAHPFTTSMAMRPEGREGHIAWFLPSMAHCYSVYCRFSPNPALFDHELREKRMRDLFASETSSQRRVEILDAYDARFVLFDAARDKTEDFGDDLQPIARGEWFILAFRGSVFDTDILKDDLTLASSLKGDQQGGALPETGVSLNSDHTIRIAMKWEKPEGYAGQQGATLLRFRSRDGKFFRIYRLRYGSWKEVAGDSNSVSHLYEVQDPGFPGVSELVVDAQFVLAGHQEDGVWVNVGEVVLLDQQANQVQ